MAKTIFYRSNMRYHGGLNGDQKMFPIKICFHERLNGKKPLNRQEYHDDACMRQQ